MKKINQIGIALLISAIIGCGVVKGQESGESFTGINFSSFSDNGVLALSGTNMISVKSWSDDQLTILVGALGEVSTIPITSLPTNRWGGPIGGTYWSLQNPGMPPLPSDTLGVDVWPMADGSFLLDDLDLDYSGGSGSPMGMRAMDSPAGPGFGDGGGGTNYYATTNSYVQPNYGTNLWIAQTAVASGYLTGVGSNTLADIEYEIQSRTNLMQIDWQSEGFVAGSELTNWTPLSVWQGQRKNLFIRLRSWEDTYDIGIPDWWQFEYFGTNGIDPDASPAGDGYSNIEKFEMGLNPTNYYNPNGPPGFFGYVDATGTNVFIAWNHAPGPVINYSIQRGILNSLTGLFTYSQIGTVSSNANFIEDAGAINNSNSLNNLYQLEAVYPGGSLSATDTWQVSWYSLYGISGAPYGPPFPTNFYAYADTTATNVLLSWNPASSGVTNYLIEQGIFNTLSNAYIYHQIAALNSSSNSFKVIGAITNDNNWSDDYAVVAVYPGGGLSASSSSLLNIGYPNGSVGPRAFYGYANATGTNLVLAWTPAAGTPTNYVIFGGTLDLDTGNYDYTDIATVSGSSNALVIVNGMNNLYDIYSVFAVYAGGSFSQAASWFSNNGAPTPTGFVAYLDATGTNVLLSWNTPVGTITGYLIQRSDDYGDTGTYYQIGTPGVGTNLFENVGAVNTDSFNTNATEYEIQSALPGGGLSSAVTATVSVTLPPPNGLSAVVDSTGTNALLTWYPAYGAATNYIIERGVLNTSTGVYSYSSIGTVGAGTTSFTDYGALTGPNNYNNKYQVEAVYPGGEDSGFDSTEITETAGSPQANIYVTANLIRNQTGRWQVMFSGLSTNTTPVVQLLWEQEGYVLKQQTISVVNLTNNIYQIPDADVLVLLGYIHFGVNLAVQPIGPNGEAGEIVQAGQLASDAPYFVDGRVHMKQNLNFLVRAAAINQLFFNPSNEGGYNDDQGEYNETATNFEEFSFLDHFEPSFEDLYYFQLNDLWPFTANYELSTYLVDTSRTNDGGVGVYPYGTNFFTFVPDFANSIPAPPVLAHADPYWILQPGFNYYVDPLSLTPGTPPSSWGLTVNEGDTSASMSSGGVNLFGLPFENGCIIGQTNFDYSFQSLAPGDTVATAPGSIIENYASWCPAPTLVLTNYYFAPLINPGVAFGSDLPGIGLPGELDPAGGSNVQPFPVPIEDNFNVTNQTPPLIGTVGQPIIVGGWAKYSVQNGSTATGKYAYLGQYYETNAFLLNNDGTTSTNSAGILSPYGEFFPLQAGVAELVTMPDIDSAYEQGTGIVRIVSMCADANHDGVLDVSYAGPDQTSPSRPLKFWINDNQDSGDFGGNFGIPGQGAQGDGLLQDRSTVISTWPMLLASSYPNGNYSVHGRRDLVDFFPVYLNIGSLFQSNALSAGISATDTNWQFVLSQADSALRYAYTGLTPTNYMNYLRDAAVTSSNLAYAPLVTISNSGAMLPPSFVSAIATNNLGIILVEAAVPTTQPLVLTIYHGTNQIAQTSLYLSITGVEQMFRSKTMMLNPAEGTVPDRLTDASVPNEPDTIDKNFVFMHGYNVNPNEARGVAADMYKRMYWSGSHAKFWAVTWEGADSKLGSIFTPNYHTNVVNAFNTAPLLANFIASLTNSGPVVAAAHSLGNMLTLSAISDWNTPISQYFMMDSAVPIEAIDPASTNVAFMTFSTWGAYSNRLFASYWSQLFPTNDARSTLSWNNRLGNLGSVDVYNFYSSGEEVLRLTAGDPPLTTINIVATTLINASLLWPKVPFGTYSWYWQEKGKGTCNEDGLIGSSHGGWKFSTYWVSGGNPLSPTIMNNTTNTILQTQPMFDFNSTANNFLLDVDSELLGSVPGVNPSTYAATYRNRILSDAIPAMSLVAGANPVPRLSPPISPSQKNIDMMTLENGWSLAVC